MSVFVLDLGVERIFSHQEYKSEMPMTRAVNWKCLSHQEYKNEMTMTRAVNCQELQATPHKQTHAWDIAVYVFIDWVTYYRVLILFLV